VAEPAPESPGPGGVLRQLKGIFHTCLSSAQNRGELFLLELEEEKTHVIELLIWAMAVGLLGLMFLASLTVTIVWLCPHEYRIYAMGGFCLLYALGAIFALLNLKSLLRDAPIPFSGTVEQIKKDREWLESSQ
jgi:uncharacterized membrane protein YqjE